MLSVRCLYILLSSIFSSDFIYKKCRPVDRLTDKIVTLELYIIMLENDSDSERHTDLLKEVLRVLSL